MSQPSPKVLGCPEPKFVTYATIVGPRTSNGAGSAVPAANGTLFPNFKRME